MAKNIPLSDAEFWDWIVCIRDEASRKIANGAGMVVVTCSSLKRKHRDVIRVEPYYSHDVLVHFIYLQAPQEILLQRVQARKSHFIDANIVHSLFNNLEPPGKEETDVITVDTSGTVEAVEEEVLSKVQAVVNVEMLRRDPEPVDLINVSGSSQSRHNTRTISTSGLGNARSAMHPSSLTPNVELDRWGVLPKMGASEGNLSFRGATAK